MKDENTKMCIKCIRIGNILKLKGLNINRIRSGGGEGGGGGGVEGVGLERGVGFHSCR